MGEIRKPDMPPKMMSKCVEFYDMLKTLKTFTKEEIAAHFNISERSARDMVSAVAKLQPIIATSDQRGYRLAGTLKDYNDAKHQWAELDSRIAELEARKKPLIRFCEKVEKIQSTQSN